MWGILLIRRRIAVEGLQRGRSALRMREREGRLGVEFGLVGLVNGSWTDVYYSEDMKTDGLQCFL